MVYVMTLKEEKDIVTAIQFLFDPNDFGRLLKTSDQDIQVYKITPGGKKFVGYTGLRDPLWARPFDLLCENTLSF